MTVLFLCNIMIKNNVLETFMENSINSDIIRGHIDTIILNTLLKEDKSVNKIIDEISQKSQGEYEIKQATLYSSLKRLENDKYVRAYFNDTDDLGRRKFYNLTEKGRSYVENNLKSWNYSRKIINELLSADADNDINENIDSIRKKDKNEANRQQPIFEEKVSETSATITEKNVNEPEIADFSVRQAKLEETLLKKQQEIKNEESYSNIDNDEAINYRQVIQNIIAKSAVGSNADEDPVVYKNNTVEEPKINVKKAPISQSVNKINLNDLTQLSQSSGIKVRVSSKEKVKDIGNVLINKLITCSSWLIYLVFIAEILVLAFSIDSSAKVSSSVYLISAFVGLLFPIVSTICYVRRPKKSISRLANAKTVFVSTALVIFNIILIFLAVILLAELDLSIYRNIILYIVFPAVVLIDIPLYFIIKYKLLNTFKFYIK